MYVVSATNFANVNNNGNCNYNNASNFNGVRPDFVTAHKGYSPPAAMRKERLSSCSTLQQIRIMTAPVTTDEPIAWFLHE